MEPNWNRLWEKAYRKICTRDEFVAKFDEVHDNSEDYIYEYVSANEWNDNNPEEVYFKISKRQVSYDN
jgi:hypothetical protein|tara:strand:- start:726 stop:929 length:204 start_codon:yes stop_codon:yes gene_type:complete